MITRRHLAGLAASSLAAPALAQAPWSPTRSIRVLVGFTAGGGTDVTTRIVAGKMQTLLGQPIVVENRPGGAGNIASEATVTAAPDGHTLMMGTIASLVMNPLISRLSFDMMTDLTPIGRSVDVTNFLVVPADRPWRDLPALIAAARAQPEAVAYGSSGVGSAGHLAGALLEQRCGIRTVHVPYRGGGQLITDILSGKVDYAVATAATTLQHVEAGRLRALGVPTPARSALAPDVPTIAEAAGLPGYEVANWYALMGPRAMPEPIVTRLNDALVEALRDPEVAAGLSRHGLEPAPSSAADLGRFMREETARWGPVLREAGASAN
ncbi:Bug family tripartite tricarboxylate transporter substrate binding protein [Plastoroseomonas arctica]|uniref:Tripartite tricarboxylate transporter substrate binding protein n=1 Tax=Plastoroseomonas arctica TaxID=1509237 RepID=A0AAF1JVL4_9PROT|nr:tripartite tricarboxylate transporter substrate binding protein [Plastoroseomonas arctica]MBR0654122.1 tripartite tricarboxylate transporter substrate binding protein [Plastoroseomonas arctica]